MGITEKVINKRTKMIKNQWYKFYPNRKIPSDEIIENCLIDYDEIWDKNITKFMAILLGKTLI